MSVRPIPSQDRIVELYQAGTLARELGAYHSASDDGKDAFLKTCIEVHNHGRIDLLSVVHQPAFAALDSHEFFTAQQVYCDAVPHLAAEASALMDCCRVLVERAGDDLAGSMPFGAFREWCANNRAQAALVIEDAKSGKESARDFVTFALQGLGNVEEAVAFVERFTDERRLYGMTALGQMTLGDEASARGVLAVLEPFTVAEWTDRVRANALSAAFGVLRQHPDAPVARRLVEAVAQEPGADSLHALAQVLFQRQVALDTETTRIALRAMQGVGKDYARTVSFLSNALYRMLDTADEVLALDTLTEMLKNGEWGVDDFGTVMQKIATGTPQRLHALTVRWLLSGSSPLGNSVSHLARNERGGGFGINMEVPALTEAEQVFLCRKAVAFLFLRPKSCCSVLIAVLRSADEPVCNYVRELLVNPMLMSYGGVQEHLATVLDSDPAHAHVQAALDKFREHRAALDAIDDIQELRPSERQRHVVRAQKSDQMREVYKQAEKSSVLLNLVHRTHVLYGRRTLTFLQNPDGTRRSLAMDLHPHSTSMELPSLEWLDPVGLDVMLRTWRVMRRP